MPRERADSPERRDLLFAMTVFSSLASDVASPVAQLLRGPHGAALREPWIQWRDRLQAVAAQSEPWVAAKIRGLVGALGTIR